MPIYICFFYKKILLNVASFKLIYYFCTPAVHFRPVPAIVKTVKSPDLSLRGRFAPVAISQNRGG